MSRTDLELRLVRWLDEGPEAAPTKVIEAALREARGERQARVVQLPWLADKKLALPSTRALAQTAFSALAIVVAASVLWWGLNSVTLPPATSPTPTVTATPSTAPTPAVTPSPSPTSSTIPSPSASPSAGATSSPTRSPFFTPPVGAWQTPELIEAGEFADVAVAVDASTGAAYVAASIDIGTGDSRGIVYITSSGGAWTSKQVTIAPSGQDDLEYDGEPDIAVGPDGTVWIAFTRYDCGGCTPTLSSGVYVINNAGGKWSKPELVGGPQSYDPSLAVGANGAYLAYASGQMPEASSYPIYFATNESGRWVNTKLDGNNSHPQLALAADGIPRVAFAMETGIEINSFPSPDSEFFEVVPGTTGNVEALFFTIDDAGQAHLVWLGRSLPMQHMVEAPDGRWSQPEDFLLDRLYPDSIATYGGQGELITSATSLDESGAWFVTGPNAAATELAAGETVRTDLAAAPGHIEFVYSYAGDQGQHGIWLTSTGGE